MGKASKIYDSFKPFISKSPRPPKTVSENFKMPISEVQAKPSTNFGLGGIGQQQGSLHDRFTPRQPPGQFAKPPNNMPTIGYNNIPSARPQSLLEGGMEQGANELRDMKQTDKLKDMLEFIYKIPKGLLSLPMLIDMHVMKNEGFLGGRQGQGSGS
tara:strand:+ start:72 stop:539 length:468 start_codon:yes stop_codon:yes gene_type:complete